MMKRTNIRSRVLDGLVCFIKQTLREIRQEFRNYPASECERVYRTLAIGPATAGASDAHACRHLCSNIHDVVQPHCLPSAFRESMPCE